MAAVRSLVFSLTLVGTLRAVVSKEIVFILAFLAIDVFLSAVKLWVCDTCTVSCAQLAVLLSSVWHMYWQFLSMYTI